MFDDLRNAWREAVENFRRELDGGNTPDARVNAMRRDIARIRDALRRLDSELATARAEVAEERREEAAARRREALARQIGDLETVTLAAEYAARHQRRAEVLERKVEVLAAEQQLRAEDAAVMERLYAEEAAKLRAGANAPAVGRLEDEERIMRESAFSNLEREAREKAADARLQELKRRMR